MEFVFNTNAGPDGSSDGLGHHGGESQYLILFYETVFAWSAFLQEPDDPEEPEQEVDHHGEVVEAGGKLGNIPEQVVALLPGAQQAPVHVVVPPQAVEGSKHLESQVENASITANLITVGVEGHNYRRNHLGKVLTSVIELSHSLVVVELVQTLPKTPPEWQNCNNYDIICLTFFNFVRKGILMLALE